MHNGKKSKGGGKLGGRGGGVVVVGLAKGQEIALLKKKDKKDSIPGGRGQWEKCKQLTNFPWRGTKKAPWSGYLGGRNPLRGF